MTKVTLQIIKIKKYKITNIKFSTDIIHFNTQKQVNTEKVLKKRHFNDVERT